MRLLSAADGSRSDTARAVASGGVVWYVLVWCGVLSVGDDIMYEECRYCQWRLVLRISRWRVQCTCMCVYVYY